jgi:cell division septation protein DedD
MRDSHSIRKFAACILAGLILLAGATLPAQSRIVKTFRVQVASSTRRSDAETIRQRAVNASSLPVFLDEVQGTFKVTVGDFSNYRQALPDKDRLLAKGFNGSFIVEVLSEVSDEESTVYKIQVGNFRGLVNARQLQDQLVSRGVKAVSIDRQDDFLKVRVGHYKDYASAAKDAQILQKSGYPDAWVTKAPASEALVERRSSRW